MHRGGKVLVSELRSAVAADDIAVSSVADRCLLSGDKGDRTDYHHAYDARSPHPAPRPYHDDVLIDQLVEALTDVWRRVALPLEGCVIDAAE